MQSSILVLIITSIIIVSYFFNVFSQKTKVPSVLLLMGTGILLSYFGPKNFLSDYSLNKMVEVLGILGLIMIILEASLDLHLSKAKRFLIIKAFVSALFILFLSSFSIAGLLKWIFKVPFLECLIYATPLSIVSSAILLPSLGSLSNEKKEFLIYEASFSDILGILLFNYLITDNASQPFNAIMYLGQMFFAGLISILVAILLVYYLGKIKLNVKFFLIFSVLAALYALGKIWHLPSLLIILFFGIIINNRHLFNSFGFVSKHIPDEKSFQDLENQLKSVTAESSFLIRTFFFLLFGYSIDIFKLLNSDVQVVGSLIVVILLIVRLGFLQYVNPKSNPFPELFLMPRGLITILLFYNIPIDKQLNEFNSGIMFFVILVTGVLMMIGLMTAKDQKMVGEIEV